MKLSTNSPGLCCTSMQVLSSGRGLVLLVQQSKETPDCVVCFDSHRSEEPSGMSGTSRAPGFRVHELLFMIAASTFNCFWFWLPKWDKCSYAPHPTGMELIYFLPPGRGSGIFLWDVGVCTVVMLTDPQSIDSESLHQTLPSHPLTVDTPAPTPPSPMPTHNQSSWRSTCTGPHACAYRSARTARFLVMLNNSPHAGTPAHSELWPRFSGTAPWWTCRRTRRSASL